MNCNYNSNSYLFVQHFAWIDGINPDKLWYACNSNNMVYFRSDYNISHI